MKNLIYILLLSAISSVSLASVCSDSRPLWDGDSDIGQLECAGEDDVDICITKFKAKSDGEIYYHITSSQGDNYRPIHTWLREGDDENYLSDKNGTLLMQYNPTPAAIIHSHKERHQIEIDKKTLQMWYTKERKRVWSLEFWKKNIDTRLQCRRN